jgi:hypothetical protein
MFEPFSGTHSGCLAFGAPPLAPVPAGQAIGALPARHRGLSVVPRGLLCASRAAAAGGAGDPIEIPSPAATAGLSLHWDKRLPQYEIGNSRCHRRPVDCR